MKKNRAFTLAELLVALVILSVLMVIVLQASSKMMAASASVKCQNNLRQLASAALQYAHDRNGVLPDRGCWSDTPLSTQRFSILPYLNIPCGNPTAFYLKKSVLTCPEMQAKHPSSGALLRTYAINQWAAGTSQSELSSWQSTVVDKDAPLRLSKAKPTQAFFMEAPMISEGSSFRFSVYQRPDRFAPFDDRVNGGWLTPYIHRGHAHVVFIDGHIEAISEARAQHDLVGNTNGTPSPRITDFWGAGN